MKTLIITVGTSIYSNFEKIETQALVYDNFKDRFSLKTDFESREMYSFVEYERGRFIIMEQKLKKYWLGIPSEFRDIEGTWKNGKISYKEDDPFFINEINFKASVELTSIYKNITENNELTKIVLLCADSAVCKSAAVIIQFAVNNVFPKIKVTIRFIPSLNITIKDDLPFIDKKILVEGISNLKKIILEYKNSDIFINISGGYKIISFYTIQFCTMYNIQIQYLLNEELINL